jgi:hypothetical protein
MSFAGTVTGLQAALLVDSGASLNFVSQTFVTRHGLATSPHQGPLQTATLADGSATPIMGTLLTQLWVQNVSCSVMLHVLALDSPWDVILGEPWLLAHHALLNFKDRTVRGSALGNSFCWRCPKGRTDGVSKWLLTLVGARRAI